jgi:transcription elongation factor Elf1
LSRNKDRLGGSQHQDTQPPAQTGGFSFVVPTEFVELPSQGKFYPESHPLHGKDSIEIRQMTAKEEDMLTSATLLKKGVALDRVIASLIVDKSINPDSLLVGDRNAIIISTRVSGYGNIYETKVNCPNCGTNQEYSFDLNKANIYDGSDAADLGVRTNDDGTFNVTLPRTNVDVQFRLLNGRDEKTFLNGMKSDKKAKSEKNITRQLATIVVSLNGDSSVQAKQYFIDNVPSLDSRHLRLAYRLAAPTIDLTQQFECVECSHEQEMEVPLSADFFWSN